MIKNDDYAKVLIHLSNNMCLDLMGFSKEYSLPYSVVRNCVKGIKEETKTMRSIDKIEGVYYVKNIHSIIGLDQYDKCNSLESNGIHQPKKADQKCGNWFFNLFKKEK